MMYYRRKLLLALLEVFDGSLKRTDCEKLLFNFCETTSQNHYDFFPYQYGPFSFISYYDKRRLTDLGFLKDTNDFELKISHSYLEDITPTDKSALLNIKKNGLRGRNLVKKTYQEYPQYAARSKITTTLFSPEEIRRIRSAWNTSTKPIVFTIGYEGLSIDAFLNKLIANNIIGVVDVRNNPHSMKYGFSKRSFGNYIERAGINYFHIPELGIPSILRKELGTSITHKNLFIKYRAQILPKQKEAELKLLNLIEIYPRIALVCFEADYHLCHRMTLVEYLKKEYSLSKNIIHL